MSGRKYDNSNSYHTKSALTADDLRKMKEHIMKSESDFVRIVIDPSKHFDPFGKHFNLGSLISEEVHSSKSANVGPPMEYTEARRHVEKYIRAAPEQSFSDIIGNEDALERLKDSIEAPVKNKELYERYKMPMPKGALLYGPPGCGKTMFAKAAVSEMKRLYGGKHEFISLSGTEIQSTWVGETERRIVQIFDFAREYKKFHGHPLLVFIDEAEVILPDRTGRMRQVYQWEESNVSTFLSELDGMKENGAFIMLASNRPEMIDEAILRDGRCDFKIKISRPTIDAIEIIMRNNFEGSFVCDSIDELVFTAVEAMTDPHKVIAKAQAIWGTSKEDIHTHGKDFTLEHILSGAMAASLPTRAARVAFAREKKAGTAEGIKVNDVIEAVKQLYEENINLEHSFAIEEFKQQFGEEVQAKIESERNKKLN